MPAPCPPQPFSLREVGRTEPPERGLLSFEPGVPSTGRVALVVHSNLYAEAAVSNAVAQYAADIARHGFSSVTLTFSGSAEELRTVLSNYYYSAESLKGAMLIGDLPYAVWEMYKKFDQDPALHYEAEIADIFFMDLDGTWLDTNGTPPFAAGRYDTREGDLFLEIWMSRVRAAGMTAIPGYSEAALTSNFFARVHAYRTTNMVVNKSALHFTDYDWTNWVEHDVEELEAAYASVTSRACNVPLGIGGAEYRDRWLTNNLELIQVRVHGTAVSQEFEDGVIVTSADYTNRDPRAVFYNLYACSGADFLTSNNLARIATLNPEANGLLAWSHSGVGGMISFYNCDAGVFYNALGAGETAGEAFRLWFNACVEK